MKSRTFRRLTSALGYKSGKGDHDRVNLKKFQEGWDHWHRKPEKKERKCPACGHTDCGSNWSFNNGTGFIDETTKCLENQITRS